MSEDAGIEPRTKGDFVLYIFIRFIRLVKKTFCSALEVEDERRPPEDSNKRRGSSRRLSFSAHPASDSDVSEH